jgi:hypothetical protein
MSASIPHTIRSSTHAYDLHVAGRSLLKTEEELVRAQRGGIPRPIPVSAPPTRPTQQQQQQRRSVSRSVSPPNPRTSPHWSPGGSEGRFGSEFNSSPDPEHFLRRGTGELSHSVPSQLTRDEIWQQQRSERNAAAAGGAKPSSPPHARHGRDHSRLTLLDRADRSASASVSPHPFLRAHSGGHAHPDLPLKQGHTQHQRDDAVYDDIELELSGEVVIEELNNGDNAEFSQATDPMLNLSPLPPQRYPFIRRGPEQPASAPPLSHPPSATNLSMAGSSSASMIPARPGSTIASFIQRFREQPPQPPSNRITPPLPFWWAQQSDISAHHPPANANTQPIIPPLSIPLKHTKMSTAEHLKQMEQDIDSQREMNKQQKLQQLEQQLRAEQESEERNQQHRPDQQYERSAAIDGSFTHEATRDGVSGAHIPSSCFDDSGDLSLLAELNTVAPLSPSHPSDGTMDRQPRMSILDDSDDFSALIAPARSQQHQQNIQSNSSTGVSQSGGFVTGLASSHDVDELLRKWRAERATGVAVPTLRTVPLSPLQSISHTRSYPTSVPPSVASLRMNVDENTPAISEVEKLISGLKKRLGLDNEEISAGHLPFQHLQSRVPLQSVSTHPRINTMHSASFHCSPTRSAKSPLVPSPHRVVGTKGGPLEELLQRPGPAQKEYLDSARDTARASLVDVGTSPIPAGMPSGDNTTSSGGQQLPFVIPPLKFPTTNEAATNMVGFAPHTPLHSTARDSTTRTTVEVEDEREAVITHSPPRARAAPVRQTATIINEEAKYAEAQQPYHSSHSASVQTSSAPLPSHAHSHLLHPSHYVPLVEYEALQRAHARELAKAECARLLRKQRKKEKRAASTSRKRSIRPKGIISIHISPIDPPNTSTAVIPPAPVAESSTLYTTDAPPSNISATIVDEQKDAVSGPRPVIPTQQEQPATVHYISNVPPSFATYSLPASPTHRVEPSGVNISSPHTSVTEDHHTVQEIVTRGLICDPHAYSTIVQQLHPAVTNIAPIQPSLPHSTNASAAAASVNECEEKQEHTQPFNAPTPSISIATQMDESASIPLIDVGTSIFSPSSAHLARLCAELGVTIAEYESDAPLRVLVHQLNSLQQQQVHAHALTQRSNITILHS